MTIASISALNTFLEHVVKTNEIAAWINGAEAGTSSIQNTSVQGVLFQIQTGNHGISVSPGNVYIANTVTVSVGTLVTNTDNISVSAIASANVVNVVHQTTRSAFSTANSATTTAASAYGQANTATTSASAASGTAAAAYGQANSATTTASAAFDKANSSTVADDTSPQLSANLDAQLFGFDNVGTVHIVEGQRLELAGSDGLANVVIEMEGQGWIVGTRASGNTAVTPRVKMTSDGDFQPYYDDQIQLGSSSKGWKNVYIGNGGWISWNNDTYRLTQAANVITWGGDFTANAWVGASGRFDDVATSAEVWSYANNKVLTLDGMWDAVGYKAVTSDSSIVLDMSANANFNVAVGQNLTIANPTGAKPGQSGVVVYSANGARTVSYGTDWVFESDSAPSASGNTAARDILSYVVMPNKKIFATLFTNVPVT